MTNTTNRSFQLRVVDWMMETFSMQVCRDKTERNHRFLEESLELVQAMGCTASEAHQLVDYVYGRPVGDPEQEVGGVMVTLAALCAAADISMTELGDRELARCWKNIEKIRAKQAAKPPHSPLPGPSPEQTRAYAMAHDDPNLFNAVQFWKPHQIADYWQCATPSGPYNFKAPDEQTAIAITQRERHAYESHASKLLVCQHDLLKPPTTIDVHSPTHASCRVCKQHWNNPIGLAESLEKSK